MLNNDTMIIDNNMICCYTTMTIKCPCVYCKGIDFAHNISSYREIRIANSSFNWDISESVRRKSPASGEGGGGGMT